MPGTVLGTGDAPVKKVAKFLLKLISQQGRRTTRESIDESCNVR